MLSLLTSVVSPVLFIGIATHSEWQHKLKVQAIKSNSLLQDSTSSFRQSQPCISCHACGARSQCHIHTTSNPLVSPCACVVNMLLELNMSNTSLLRKSDHSSCFLQTGMPVTAPVFCPPPCHNVQFQWTSIRNPISTWLGWVDVIACLLDMIIAIPTTPKCPIKQLLSLPKT